LRHGRKSKKLGRKFSHRKALIKNLLAALFTHERIKTTIGKAKETRRFVDRLITFAKENTLAARREVRRYLHDESLVHKLFTDIAPRLEDRQSGYTRIFRLGPRMGDAAEMAILELVSRKEKEIKKETKKEAKKVKEVKEKKSKAEKPKEKGKEKEKSEKASKAKKTKEKASKEKAKQQ
jgi:large subunit ribosomal protein L17